MVSKSLTDSSFQTSRVDHDNIIERIEEFFTELYESDGRRYPRCDRERWKHALKDMKNATVPVNDNNVIYIININI